MISKAQKNPQYLGHLFNDTPFKVKNSQLALILYLLYITRMSLWHHIHLTWGRQVAKYRETNPTKRRTHCEKVIGIYVHVISISILLSVVYGSYLNLKTSDVWSQAKNKYHALTIRFAKLCEKILPFSLMLLLCYKYHKNKLGHFIVIYVGISYNFHFLCVVLGWHNHYVNNSITSMCV